MALTTAATRAPDTRTVRIAVKSGSQQSAHAWAAAGANLYETVFNDSLAVTVSPADTRVRFRCLTPGCVFPPSDQPDGTDRVDKTAFDVTSDNGVASIKLTIRTISTGPVIVIAQPSNNPHGPTARFVLIAR